MPGWAEAAKWYQAGLSRCSELWANLAQRLRCSGRATVAGRGHQGWVEAEAAVQLGGTSDAVAYCDGA